MTLHDTLPASWYHEAAYFDVERVSIFRESWIPIGLSCQLQSAGDYVTENVAGWPIFVQRQSDGSLRAFHNVCPHRAGPIVWDGSGCQKNLVCKYHGWAFSTAGELLNARDFGAPAPDGAALSRIAVDEWRGILFVCLSKNAQPLEVWLAGFPAALSDVPLETYSFFKRTSKVVKCNWKTYADNFLEGYHLPTVHPRMTRDGEAGLYSVELHEDLRWNIHRMPGRGESTFSLFGWFWPTFAFNALPDGFAIERWLPRGPDEIELIFEYMFKPGSDAEASFSFSEEVAQEDVLICEHVQRNLTSGTYDTGKLSPKWEKPLHAFHQLVRDSVCPAVEISVRDTSS